MRTKGVISHTELYELRQSQAEDTEGKWATVKTTKPYMQTGNEYRWIVTYSCLIPSDV
jgi:hypothetical protein